MGQFDFRVFMESVRALAGEAPPPDREHFLKQAQRILRMDGLAFLQHAYWLVFARDVDPRGIQAYSHLVHTPAGRLRVLCSMCLSSEASNTPFWLRRSWKALRGLRKGRRGH